MSAESASLDPLVGSDEKKSDPSPKKKKKTKKKTKKKSKKKKQGSGNVEMQNLRVNPEVKRGGAGSEGRGMFAEDLFCGR